jgi:hypothetical protein
MIRWSRKPPHWSVIVIRRRDEWVPHKSPVAARRVSLNLAAGLDANMIVDCENVEPGPIRLFVAGVSPDIERGKRRIRRRR